ncbi:MAG: hypothetical protein K8S54_10670 [Spirochaetia bacterium]|nr:hypothetical protein [Spirochaetia bacterium]
MADLAALLPDCPFTLFQREAGGYRAVLRQGYVGSFEYTFLSEQPDLWAAALANGVVRVPDARSSKQGFEVWVVVDPPGLAERLLVVELPAAVDPGFLLVAMLATFRNVGSGLPPWMASYVADFSSRKSPLLIIAEAGSGLEELIAEFLRKRFGPEVQAEYFQPGRLSAQIQMREIFGDAAGARLGGEGSGVPLLARGLDVIVVQEVADLDLAVQRRLMDLFVSDEHSVYWILATTRDLPSLARAGLFSSALADLLKGGQFVLPPLRKARDIIRVEGDRILADLQKRYNRQIELGVAARRAIEAYDWPGNWAELRKTLESAFLTASGGEISPEDLRLGQWVEPDSDDLNLRRRARDLEKQILLRAYALHSGNQVQMARALGISRGSLQYKMTKYGLQ